MHMKYIMFKGNTSFLMFPAGMNHNEVAPKGVEILSAGFVEIALDPSNNTTVVAHCSGGSDTLDIDSRPRHDSEVITIALNL